jgi:hypothetical protein
VLLRCLCFKKFCIVSALSQSILPVLRRKQIADYIGVSTLSTPVPLQVVDVKIQQRAGRITRRQVGVGESLYRIGVLPPNARLRSEIIPSGPVNANDPSADHGDAPPPSAPTRIRWARLLKQVFDIDMEQCPQCGGTLKISAAIEHPTVIAKIPTHLGLSARAPPRSSAQACDRFQTA